MANVTSHYYDLIIIGGGINGAGIARDAAGRGLKVLLCDQGDFAAQTSSRSSKLIHGGLRYLEYCDFRLVREALQERDILLKIAPHIVWPLRFVLPLAPKGRPAWLVRLGLFLYDSLHFSSLLPRSKTHDLKKSYVGKVLSPRYQKAFEYSDCWVQDTRLVIANLLSASEEGAVILPYRKCVSAVRGSQMDGWEVTLKRQFPWDTAEDAAEQLETVRGRVVVNAGGPWVQHLTDTVFHASEDKKVRLVQGSHIIVPRFIKSEQSCILQVADGRIVFVLPYEGQFNLVGTTDRPYDGDPHQVEISKAEKDYLLNVLNTYFEKDFSDKDIVSHFSGVRPLFDDMQGNPSAVTRDYVFDLDRGMQEQEAPILSVFGGKITTYRRLAEHALEKLAAVLPIDLRGWTGQAPLPGGAVYEESFEDFKEAVYQRYKNLPVGLVNHYLDHYGKRIFKILPKRCESVEELGQHFGAHFYEAEARYLMLREWSFTAESLLWNRTKWGLHLTQEEQANFRQWFSEREKALKRHQMLNL